jgi:hypothetical protein
MARHHYVPQFLLRQWASGGQLLAYRWIEAAGKLVDSRVSVASACQIDDLHAFFGAPAGEREAPEREYFTPKVDTPASAALEIIVSGGVTGLSPPQRAAWARFLVAFGVRTPETLRVMGPTEWQKAMALAQTRGPRASAEVEAFFAKWLETNSRALERNKPLEIAMDLSSDPAKIVPVAQMEWWVRPFGKNALLIGDRPLLSSPPMRYPCGIPLKDPNGLVVLPIAPHLAFFATPNPKTIAKVNGMPLDSVARIINEETTWQAKEYVFAADASLAAFIAPRLEGKARGTWQPETK